MTDLCSLAIHELSEKFSSGETSSATATEAYLDRINAVNEKINAYVTVDREGALTQAQEADNRRANGEDHPLLGVPLGLKDLIATKGVLDYLLLCDSWKLCRSI